jgi:hypothetical protein
MESAEQYQTARKFLHRHSPDEPGANPHFVAILGFRQAASRDVDGYQHIRQFGW